MLSAWKIRTKLVVTARVVFFISLVFLFKIFNISGGRKRCRRVYFQILSFQASYPMAMLTLHGNGLPREFYRISNALLCSEHVFICIQKLKTFQQFQEILSFYFVYGIVVQHKEAHTLGKKITVTEQFICYPALSCSFTQYI